MQAFREFWCDSQWHPFVDFEFFSVFTRSSKEIVHPCVLALFRDDKPVALWVGRMEEGVDSITFGYLPLFRAKVRRLSFSTGGVMGDTGDAAVRAMLAKIDGLIRDWKLDYAVLNNVRDEGPLPALASRQGGAVFRDRATVVNLHWTMSLPATLAEFLNRRKKKHRYWLNRLPRVLERDFPGRVETKIFTTVEGAATFCADAAEVSRMTYQRKLGGGFVDDALTRQRCEIFARRGLFYGYILYLDGQPKAFWCATHYQGTFFLDSTGYHSDFRKYEIGTVLFLKLVEDACSRGISKADFGVGTAGYKERFCDENWTDRSIRLYARTAKSAVLNSLRQIVAGASAIAQRILRDSGFLQRVKTFWRSSLRKKTAEENKSEGNNETE